MQRLTPDGYVEINFSMDAPMKRKNSDGTSFIMINFYLTSRFSDHYFVQPIGAVRMIGIRFFPWGIRPFIKVPASEIADRFLTHEEIFGSRIKALQQMVLDADAPRNAIREIEKYFILELYRQEHDDMIVSKIARRIYDSKGIINLDELCSASNLSVRRIEQRFNDALGVCPKLYSRLAKFQHAMQQLSCTSDDDNLTGIAYDCGYFDQSHFIKDFKDFAGITPQKYLSETHPLNDLKIDSAFVEL